MSEYKQLLLMVPGVKKQEDKTDFYRSLSARGIYQTLNVANKIKEDSYDDPEFIFAATALYMRQTAEIIRQTFPSAVLVFRDNLYAAHEKNLLHFIMHLDDIFGCLLLLTEQQPIQELTIRLTGYTSELMPSGCLCIRWPAHQSWKNINKVPGQLVQTWLP